jgi:hypothetical protein
MTRLAVRSVATAVSLVGIGLLGRLLWMAADGSLCAAVLPHAAPGGWTPAIVLALALPVPLHVIAIGLIVQRRWLSARGAQFAWIAIVGSGTWLGVALVVRTLLR